MRKGICQACLPGSSPDAQFRIAADCGFDGVEIDAPADGDAARRLKDLAEARGLEIPSIMSGSHWSHPLSSPDEATRRHTQEEVAGLLGHARQIGATAVLLVPGVVNEQITYEQAWQRSLAEVRSLAAVAEQEQVTLAIENVWNQFLLSPLEFNLFLEEVGSPRVKAYFDCGNILAYGFPQHWIRSLGDRIAKIHVKGFTRFPNVAFPHGLSSDVPWAACRDAWRQVGYDDYLTVEIEPDPKDPEGSIRRYGRELDAVIAGSL